MTDPSQQPPTTHLARLAISADDPDITLICDGRAFELHRYALCKHSDVLKREIESPQFEESKGVIRHEEYDTGTVERMVIWMYEGDYDVGEVESKEGKAESEGEIEANEKTSEAAATDGEEARHEQEGWTPMDILMAHALVHGIASYYNIHDLATLAVSKFIAALKTTTWPQPGFADVLQEIYKQPKREDKGLRAAVLEASIDKTTAIFQDPSFLNTPGLSEFSAAIVFDLNTSLLRAQEEKDFDSAIIASLEDAVEGHYNDAQQSKREYAKARADVMECFRLVNSFGNCQECYASVRVRLEHEDGRFLLRCLECRMEHG